MCLIIQCQPDKIVRVCLWPILTNILPIDRFALTVLCTSSYLLIRPNPHPPTAPRCYIHLRWRFNSVFKKTGNFSEEKSLRPNKKYPVICILWNMKSFKGNIMQDILKDYNSGSRPSGRVSDQGVSVSINVVPLHVQVPPI